MAGTKVRGITIELSADASGINSALNSVNKQINSTGRELKDIDRLLKLDPTNVQLLAQKQETLQRQMEQTRQKVKLLKEAEEDLKDQMVDGGTEEQKKQLAALEREIISSEKSIEKYAAEMDQAGQETSQLAQSQREAEQTTQSLSGGFSVLKGALASLAADGIRMAANALKDLITEGPAYADEILTMASKTSLATDTLQELSYMSDLVDVDVNTVAGSMQKLTKSMSSAQGGSGAAAEAFKSLGVEVVGTDGHLRDNEAVFYDVIEALGQMENETERDAKSMQIFGKSATELNPMIEAGGDALRGFAEEAHEMGYVLDGESLEALGRVQDSFDRFNRKMQSVKNTVAAGLAPAIERGMTQIQKVVERINWKKVGESIGSAFETIVSVFEWIIDHGPEVQATLAAIIAAFAAQKIAGIVQAIGSMTKALTAMNAAANANPYVLLTSVLVGMIAGIVTWSKSLGDAYWAETELGRETERLNAIYDENHAKTEEMVAAYEEMDAVRTSAISSAQAEAGHLKSLTDELGTLVDKNGEVAESDKTRAEFILNQLNTALGTEYDLNSLIAGKYAEMTSNVYQLIEAKRIEAVLAAQEAGYTEAISQKDNAYAALALTTQTLVGIENQRAAAIAERSKIEQEDYWKMTSNAQGRINAIDQEIAALDQQKAKYEEDYAAQAETVNKYMYDIEQYEANWAAAHEGNYDKIKTVSYETAQAMGLDLNDYATTVSTQARAAANSWLVQISKMVSAATGKKVEFKDAGKGMVTAIVDGQQEGKSIPVGEVKSMAEDMVSKFKTLNPEFSKSGADIPAGIAQGIANGSGTAYTAMRTLANNLLTEFNRQMEIKSPSRVMMRTARFLDEGVAVGIEENERVALNAMRNFSDRLNASMNLNAPGTNVNAAAAGIGGYNFTQNIYAPKQPSRIELYRQTNNLLQLARRK